MNSTNTNNMIRLLCVILLTLLVTACGSDALTVTTQFANTQDVDEGAIVYFEGQALGEVVEVNTQGSGATVVMELDQSASQLISADAAIVVNRLEAGSPLEFYNSSTATAGFVQDGQAIQGLDSMVQLGAWKLGDAIQLGSDSLTGYVSAFQEYLQGDKFQQDKQIIQDQVNTSAAQAQGALEGIANELVAAMQELSAAEGDAAQAVQQLGEELSPLVQDIAKSGSQLMLELEAFTEGLQLTDDAEQQSGQALLDSLVSMIETLNESIEEGVNEGESKSPL